MIPRCYRYVFVLFTCFLLFFTSGCGVQSPTVLQPPATSNPTQGKAMVKVSVDWNKFDTIQASAIKANSVSNITHVGARLEYPTENASFAQSVSKATAETLGIITMEVPPSNKANLYIVAVEKGLDIVHWYGVIENMTVAKDTVIDIKMADIRWIRATWKADDPNYQNGSLTAQASATNVSFITKVREPFQVGQNPAYDALFIGINGSGGNGSNPDGWRTYRINCVNPHQNTPNVSSCSFSHYLRAELFNLPSARYIVPPKVGSIKVSWE